MAQHWYAAVTLPSAEDIAEVNLSNQSFKSFNPKVRSLEVRRGVKVQRVRPYLPGYILVRFDTSTDRWKSVNWTKGIKRLITQDEVPVRIRDGVIEELIERYHEAPFESGPLDAVLRTYVRGERVKIVEGSFAGFPGKVEDPLPYDRMKVLITIFGRETKAELPGSFLCPACT